MLLKLLKFLSFIIILNSFAYGAYLLENKNICIDSYYYQYNDDSGKDTFYYIKSSTPDTVYYSSNKSWEHKIFPGFVYDDDNKTCKKKPILETLQIDSNTYYMLLGLVGVFVGFVFLFFGVYVAIEIAKK